MLWFDSCTSFKYWMGIKALYNVIQIVLLLLSLVNIKLCSVGSSGIFGQVLLTGQIEIKQ